MALIQIASPNLSLVATGGAHLQLLEGLGFSADGKTLLVRATFTDDADTTPGQLHYGVWTYDLTTQQYRDCLNVLLASGGLSPQQLDVRAASLAGTGTQFSVVAETRVRDSADVSVLARLQQPSGQVDANLLTTLLGSDVELTPERYALSNEGRFLAIQTDSSLLASDQQPDTNDTSDIYLLDLLTRKVERVSFVAGSGVSQPVVLGNVLTANGKVQVVFHTDAAFTGKDGNGGSEAPTDVYLWSRAFDDSSGLTGAATFSLVSALPSRSAAGFVDGDMPVSATTAGVFFSSRSNDMVSGDTNGAEDAFWYSPATGVKRIDLTGLGELSGGATFLSASSDGRYAAVLTSSREVAGAEDVQQVVVVDLQTNTWRVASKTGSILANEWITGGVIAPNGPVQAFTTTADNLVASPGVANGGNLFAAVNSPPTGTVTLTGSTIQGQTLTAGNTLADADGMATVRYQWQRNGVTLNGISGNSYVLTQDDVGKTIRAVASYTDGYGAQESVSSPSTQTVVDTTGVGVSLNPASKTISLYSGSPLSYTAAEAGTAKSAIRISLDNGQTYTNLSASDTLANQDGKLVLTFNNYPVSDSLKLQIGAGVFKSGTSTLANTLTSATIDTYLNDTRYIAVAATDTELTVPASSVDNVIDTAGAQNFWVESGGTLRLSGAAGSNFIGLLGYHLSDLQVSRSGTTVYFWNQDHEVARIGTSDITAPSQYVAVYPATARSTNPADYSLLKLDNTGSALTLTQGRWDASKNFTASSSAGAINLAGQNVAELFDDLQTISLTGIAVTDNQADISHV